MGDVGRRSLRGEWCRDGQVRHTRRVGSATQRVRIPPPLAGVARQDVWACHYYGRSSAGGHMSGTAGSGDCVKQARQAMTVVIGDGRVALRAV